MDARAAATERTRANILDAAATMLTNGWYDEVTLADIAAGAGVSQQTVVNHFGSKERLYLTGLQERIGPLITQHRETVHIGDVASVVDVAVSDYEQTGEGTLRMLALADRIDALAEAAEYGREAHRTWVISALAPQLENLDPEYREQAARLLVAALDVSMWSQLRHGQRRSVDGAKADIRRLVEAILADTSA